MSKEPQRDEPDDGAFDRFQKMAKALFRVDKRDVPKSPGRMGIASASRGHYLKRLAPFSASHHQSHSTGARAAFTAASDLFK